ncbi:XRE family transcriptional regulator [Brevibacillus choshinensis]
MRYKNLRAEMARQTITVGELAKLLGVRYATVSDKLNGRSRFFYDEASHIRRKFFPKCSLEYLFEQTDEQAEVENYALR